MWELDAALENALKSNSKQAISKLTLKTILSFITKQFEDSTLLYVQQLFFGSDLSGNKKPGWDWDNT